LASGEKDVKEYEKILKEVEWRDRQRDHSYEALTPEQHHEIALFHTLKQDPYYKHHLRTHLSRWAESTSD